MNLLNGLNLLHFFQDKILLNKIHAEYIDFFKLNILDQIEPLDFIIDLSEGYVSECKPDAEGNRNYNDKLYFIHIIEYNSAEAVEQFKINYKNTLYDLKTFSERLDFQKFMMDNIKELLKRLSLFDYVDKDRKHAFPSDVKSLFAERLQQMQLFIKKQDIEAYLSSGDRFIWNANQDLLIILIKVLLEKGLLKSESGINNMDHLLNTFLRTFYMPAQGDSKEIKASTLKAYLKLSGDFFTNIDNSRLTQRRDKYDNLLKAFTDFLK